MQIRAVLFWNLCYCASVFGVGAWSPGAYIADGSPGNSGNYNVTLAFNSSNNQIYSAWADFPGLNPYFADLVLFWNSSPSDIRSISKFQ